MIGYAVFGVVTEIGLKSLGLGIMDLCMTCPNDVVGAQMSRQTFVVLCYITWIGRCDLPPCRSFGPWHQPRIDPKFWIVGAVQSRIIPAPCNAIPRLRRQGFADFFGAVEMMGDQNITQAPACVLL